MKNYKYVAIISEFNPLHNGHAYLICKARELFPTHKIAIIMSGQFTERGEIALQDKYTRGAEAITAGADIVVELPTAYALSSAETFALGGVRLANALRGAEYLMFASESGDITELKAIATVMTENLPELSANIRKKSKSGEQYAKIMASGIMEIIEKQEPLAQKLIFDKERLKALLTLPNNILALQYIAALIRTKSTIQPITIERIGEGYNSLETNNAFCSASAIRAALNRGNETEINSILSNSVPSFVARDIKSTKKLCYPSTLDNAVFAAILTKSPSELSLICGISEGLENRIIAAAKETTTLAELSEKIKTKRYAASRISRALMCTLLSVSKKDYEKMTTLPPYANILAIKKENLPCLADIKVPVLTKYTDRQKLRKYHAPLIMLDDRANALYSHFAGISIRYNFIIVNS